MNQEELAKWLEEISLTETSDVEFEGKKFRFKKYYPISITTGMEKIENKSEKASHLIAFISVKPKLSANMINNKLPSAFITKVQKELAIYNPKPKGKSGEDITTGTGFI